MIVGKATKQPAETETYSVYFDDDLGDTENLTSSYHAIFTRAKLVAKADVAADHTAVAADAYTLFRFTAAATLTLPTGLPDGSEFYVANYTAGSDGTVACSELIDGGATLLLAVNKAAVLQRQSGTWVSVVKGTNVLVDSATEHRVRIFFEKGVDKAVYEVEITVDTDEGRRLQSELLITVKET